MRLPHFSPAAVRKVALASVICFALLVLSGGAVRLTGSGLGCPDWPSCYQHHLTAVYSFHPVVEFINRLVSAAVTVLSVATLAVTALRTPPRRDLTLLGAGLVAGIVAQIVLGGLVVLFKLNPYLVAVHFLLTIVILADAHRALPPVRQSPDPCRARRGARPGPSGTAAAVHPRAGHRSSARWSRVRAPMPGGPGAKRIPIAFRDIAEAHSTVALFLIGLTLASQFAFHHAKAPEVVLRRGRLLLEVMVLQGALGYLQYFLHDAAWVVEFHLAGVTTLWIIGIGFYLSLHRHPAEGTGVTAATQAAGAVATGT